MGQAFTKELYKSADERYNAAQDDPYNAAKAKGPVIAAIPVTANWMIYCDVTHSCMRATTHPYATPTSITPAVASAALLPIFGIKLCKSVQ